MSEPDQKQTMLIMANKDLKALRGMRDGLQFDDEIFGFHAQQAIEKALKAWISHVRLKYPFTHNLLVLFGALEECGCDVEQFVGLSKYNSFAIQFRYDEVAGERVQLDRDEVIREVTALVEHVARLIADTKPDAE
ncbi:MAG: HEPN domain-containing protein [Planctomycetota bacterium]|nr:HEPN domain-containing protein [Planctomycetota bacterium]